jgi:hypothetical protein
MTPPKALMMPVPRAMKPRGHMLASPMMMMMVMMAIPFPLNPSRG